MMLSFVINHLQGPGEEVAIPPIISVSSLDKVYKGGFWALKSVDLKIKAGEIFALLGPNGAGKTTLISTICGITNPTRGNITVGGFDILTEHRKTKSLIGLVPQELTLSAFESVWDTVRLSRGLFNKPRNDSYLEKLLKDLALWDKRDNQLRTLSGGMKRRVLIAKALAHEPRVLFLDEPTAGVDVELRKDMWELVRKLKKAGVTIILTTHYIAEAEEMADRVGVINNGRLIVVEEKCSLMKKMGKKQMVIELKDQLTAIPGPLADYQLNINGNSLVFVYDTKKEENKITSLFLKLGELGIEYKDVVTRESSLEDIFVELIK